MDRSIYSPFPDHAYTQEEYDIEYQSELEPMKTGTLQELRLKKGDVAECVIAETEYFTSGKRYICSEDASLNYDNGDICHVSSSTFRIISRAPRDDDPKKWCDMTDEEKGALLLAAHEGKVVEFGSLERIKEYGWGITESIGGFPDFAYRVKPDDVRETTNIWISPDKSGGTYRSIGTIDIINGEPDPASIRMERL